MVSQTAWTHSEQRCSELPVWFTERAILDHRGGPGRNLHTYNGSTKYSNVHIHNSTCLIPKHVRKQHMQHINEIVKCQKALIVTCTQIWLQFTGFLCSVLAEPPKTGRTAQVCHIEIVRFVFLSRFWQVCSVAQVTGWFMALCVSKSWQCTGS